ncbi:MAG TPA: hypothetical protein VKE70_36395 [Candidatus Solibacter sp.]|nr:hypothetical protein [Candidatus Solibacter sp.]
MFEKLTPSVPLRIRIKGLPGPGAFEEFDLRRFRIGDTYDVTPQLATLLVVAGYAEIVAAPPRRAEAADRADRQKVKGKRQKGI